MNKEEKESVAHLEWLLDNGILDSEDEPYINNILNLIQKQEKIIDAMAIEIYNYANLGMLKICPAEQDNGNYNLNLCKMNLAERNCILCIEEYFKKEVEEDE